MAALGNCRRCAGADRARRGAAAVAGMTRPFRRGSSAFEKMEGPAAGQAFGCGGYCRTPRKPLAGGAAPSFLEAASSASVKMGSQERM